MQKLRYSNLKLVLILSILSIAMNSWSQAGLYLYTGPSTGITSDKIYSDGGANYGYVVGFDLRTNSDPMYFMLSVERGANDIIPNNKFGFIGGNDFNYNKFKVGMGFDIKKIGRTSGLRTKVQGNFLSMSNYDLKVLTSNQVLSQNGYRELNDGIIGVSTLLGYYKKRLNLGLEFEYGFYNLVREKEDTKMSFINLVVGYKLF